MKVRMLAAISGTRNGAAYPPVGEVLELKPGDAAQDLIGNGYAERVEEPVMETAEIAPPETAARTTKPTPRGSRRSFSPKKG
jgi:hypothetical protein